MPHPLPTAATSASPPPRGEGMGVGGLSLAILAALALLAAPLSAQIIPTGKPAADILLSQALTEHRTFLTCSALEPQTHQQILQNWQRDLTAATDALTAANVPQDAIQAFADAAKPDNLMPAPDTPFEDIRQLCDSQPDWATRYAQLNFTLLQFRLPQALQ